MLSERNDILYMNSLCNADDKKIQSTAERIMIIQKTKRKKKKKILYDESLENCHLDNSGSLYRVLATYMYVGNYQTICRKQKSREHKHKLNNSRISFINGSPRILPLCIRHVVYILSKISTRGIKKKRKRESRLFSL